MSKVKPSPLPPDTMIGGYRIERKLAAGGFGVVYLAVDSEGQQFAIKEYLPSSLATRATGELLPRDGSVSRAACTVLDCRLA